MELEYLHPAIFLRVSEVDLLNQLQRVFNCTELLGVHIDSVVSVLHDQKILLDYDLADLSEILELWAVQAVLTAHFGIQRVPSLTRILVDDYGYIIELNIDVAIEIIELNVFRGR